MIWFLWCWDVVVELWAVYKIIFILQLAFCILSIWFDILVLSSPYHSLVETRNMSSSQQSFNLNINHGAQCCMLISDLHVNSATSDEVPEWKTLNRVACSSLDEMHAELVVLVFRSKCCGICEMRNAKGIQFNLFSHGLNHKYSLNIIKQVRKLTLSSWIAAVCIIEWRRDDEFEFSHSSVLGKMRVRKWTKMCVVYEEEREREAWEFMTYKHHTGVDIKLSYANHISFLRLCEKKSNNTREMEEYEKI